MRGSAFGFDRQPIHLPEIDLPAVLAPQNVALPITVEVADALDVVVVGNRSVRDRAFCFDVQAIHLPEIDLPAVVAPENVALAVVVDVAKRRGKVRRRIRARVEDGGRDVGVEAGTAIFEADNEAAVAERRDYQADAEVGGHRLDAGGGELHADGTAGGIEPLPACDTQTGRYVVVPDDDEAAVL